MYRSKGPRRRCVSLLTRIWGWAIFRQIFSGGAHASSDFKPYIYRGEVGHMRRVLTIGLFSIFSIMMAGTVMAQERQVLQEGYSGTGTGRIGSGPGGGLDNVWMRNLLAKPETIYGRVWGVDLPGKKVYLETGGGGQSATASGNSSTAFVTVELTDKTNVEAFRQIKTGDDVEIQAYRTTRVLGSGAFASEVPEGNPKALDVSVLRSTVTPSNLLPQAGFNPDTDRAINATSSSTLGGVGGECFQCYEGGRRTIRLTHRRRRHTSPQRPTSARNTSGLEVMPAAI